MQATRRLLQLLVAFCFAASWLSSAAQSTPLHFIPVIPCRVADTRNSDGTFGGPALQGNTSRDFPIPQSACNIPSTAAAYSLNVTVVPKGTLGYLTVWPSGQSQPLVSTLNSLDGRIKANAAIVPAGDAAHNEAISVFATDTTDVVLDINGYFVPATDPSALEFFSVTPCRLVDTRKAVGPLGGPSMAAGETRDFPLLSSSCSIPPNAQAYSLNVTAVPTNVLGYLTTWPVGQAQPLVSTLNDLTGTIVANAAIVPAGSGGDINVFVTDPTDVVIDVNGYFAPANAGGQSLYTVAPCRVLDTRMTTGAFSGTLAPPVDVVNSPCGIPSRAQTYVFNATVVPPDALGYLTLWPDTETQPLVSTLNALDGAITSNMAIVPNVNGLVDAFASGTTQLVMDISSYFAPVVLTPVVIIGTEPQDQAVVASASATFSVTAIGSGPIDYQWSTNGMPIVGATSATYTTPPTSSADNGTSYSVTVANSVNGFTSSPAILTVASAPIAPTIVIQPQYISVSQGNTASFYVTAAGTAPLSFQWSKNGQPIVGATSSTYTTLPTTLADNNAQFAVTVTNSAGSVPSSSATLVVNSRVYGLGGFYPLYPGNPNDLIGVQYNFQVVANEDQGGKIIFGQNTLNTPGSQINSYYIQSNVYSWSDTFANGGCTTYPPLGTDTYGQASLRNATADTPYYNGQQPAIGSGIISSDPVNWPVQTYLIDNIPRLYKSDSMSQFSINGLQGSVTIERGSTLTDVSSFERCGLQMLSTTYRMWTITTQMTGYAPVVNQVVAPDADARYLIAAYAMEFNSEFLSQPGGTFTVQFWNFAYMRESNPQWTPVSTFTTMYPYDGSGQDFGVHVVSVNGQDRVQFSNVPGNSYLPGNLPFSIAPP